MRSWMLVMGIGVGLVMGCVRGQAPERMTAGTTPEPVVTTPRPVSTVTATARPISPTPTLTPSPTLTVTPSPVPRWGAMWEEAPCSLRVDDVEPWLVFGQPSPQEPRWYDLYGVPLRPVPMGEDQWIPVIYRSNRDLWRPPLLSVEFKGEKVDLYPIPGGAIGEWQASRWQSKTRDYQYLEYWVVVYKHSTEQVHCLRWRGRRAEEGEDLGPLELRTGPYGVVLWDPVGRRMYGLRFEDLSVRWEAPYQLPLITLAKLRGAYAEYRVSGHVNEWTGALWSLFVRLRSPEGQEEWMVEGYDVATGGHWFVRMGVPKFWVPGGWRGVDWKYAWDHSQIATLRAREHCCQYQLLVYPLAACQEAGEDPCRPRVYPLSWVHRDWQAICMRPWKIFWDPEGDKLYLIVQGEPGPCGFHIPDQLWVLELEERRWRRIWLHPDEEVWARREELYGELKDKFSLDPIAWDLTEGKRLLIREDFFHSMGTVYEWLWLEEGREGEMTLLKPEDIPFGVQLPDFP